MDRQKVLLILLAAWISAAALTWFLYASTRAPRVEKTVAVQAAARDMPAGTLLRKGDLKTVRMSGKEVPKAALLDERQALDRPLLFPVSANEPLTSLKIAGERGIEGLPATIEIGMRAIAVAINDTSGVAGLIQPRARVDVLFTRPGPAAEAVTSTILEDVVVLAIGRTTEATSSVTPPGAAGQAATRPTAQSATLLVTPEQARKIELAKNLGKISLALRNPLDRTTASKESATTSEGLYSGLVRKAAPARGTNAAPPVKAEPPPPPPAPKEPPPPKKVVDVFRGSNHVQESFP